MGFRKIMWGTVLLFDFRLNGFDILPDFIGYILIFLGLSEILHLHKNFNVARIIAGILIIPSIFTLYQLPNPKNAIVFGHNPISLFLTFATSILYLVYIYYLYTGLRDKARERNHVDLANNADLIWKLIFSVNIAMMLAIAIPLLFILIFIFALVIIIFEIVILGRASDVILP